MSFCAFLLSASGRVTRAGARATRAGAHVVLVTRVSGPAHHWRRRRKPAPNIFLPLYDVRFIEASAKADVNVTEAFQAIAQQVIDRIPRGASRPASRQLSSKKSSKKGCSC